MHAEAWIDRIAVAGKTFRYTEKGPEGLAGGKKVFIVSSRGSFYSRGTPTAFLDHQETYLKNLFGFLAEAGRGDTWHRTCKRRPPVGAVFDAHALWIDAPRIARRVRCTSTRHPRSGAGSLRRARR